MNEQSDTPRTNKVFSWTRTYGATTVCTLGEIREEMLALERELEALRGKLKTPVMWGISVNGLISSSEFHRSFAEKAVKIGNEIDHGYKYKIVPLYAPPEK